MEQQRLYQYLKENGYEVSMTNNNSINGLCKNTLLGGKEEDNDFIDPFLITRYVVSRFWQSKLEPINYKFILNFRKALNSRIRELVKIVINNHYTINKDKEAINDHIEGILGEEGGSGSSMIRLGFSTSGSGKGLSKKKVLNIIQEVESIILSVYEYDYKDILSVEVTNNNDLLDTIISQDIILRDIIPLLSLVDGVGHDTISDIVANIICKDLIEYTQDFFNSINYIYNSENSFNCYVEYRADHRRLSQKAYIPNLGNKNVFLLLPHNIIDKKMKLNNISDVEKEDRKKRISSGNRHHYISYSIYTKESYNKIREFIKSEL